MIPCPPSKELSKVGVLSNLGLIFSRVTLVMRQLNWRDLVLTSRAPNRRMTVLTTGDINLRESMWKRTWEFYNRENLTRTTYTYILMWCDVMWWELHIEGRRGKTPDPSGLCNLPLYSVWNKTLGNSILPGYVWTLEAGTQSQWRYFCQNCSAVPSWILSTTTL